MCIRDRLETGHPSLDEIGHITHGNERPDQLFEVKVERGEPVSYTHLRAHETVLDLVCRLLLEKKKPVPPTNKDLCTVNDTIVQ